MTYNVSSGKEKYTYYGQITSRIKAESTLDRYYQPDVWNYMSVS